MKTSTFVREQSTAEQFIGNYSVHGADPFKTRTMTITPDSVQLRFNGSSATGGRYRLMSACLSGKRDDGRREVVELLRRDMLRRTPPTLKTHTPRYVLDAVEMARETIGIGVTDYPDLEE